MCGYKYASIHETAVVKDSIVDFSGVVLYKGARVQNSSLYDKVSVGDDSIVVNCSFGKKCSVARRNVISFSKIGEGSSTQSNTTIRFSTVGKYCAIAWNVTIGAPNHDFKRLAMAEIDYVYDDEPHEHLTSFDKLSCTIGNDVWVAAGAHVLRGVTVSDGAVIAANAVVTKDVPPYAMVAGVPAKIIGYRFDDDQIKRLEKIKWWDFSEKQLRIARPLFDGDLTDDKINQLEQIAFEDDRIGGKDNVR